jgi:site-specific recombinase XerD
LVAFDCQVVESVNGYAQSLKIDLTALRDRAFILTLADTGLRISEACARRRGDIDRLEQRALVLGKGDNQAVVRFSRRALEAIDDYLRAREDSSTGKPLPSLPLFARHDKGAGKQVKPVESGGMWKAVKRRAEEAGIDLSRIRVHDFRHYFVTMLILAGGKTEAVQRAACHASSATTSRYIPVHPVVNI